MAEPHDKPPTHDAREKPPPPAAAPSNDHVVLGDGAEPNDDAPTIISRPSSRNARPEDTFAHALRGRRLAHFDLLEPIGVGGMAAVIRARDAQLDRAVALKILPPEMASDPENIRRFQQEARAAARLDHENIARVFFCGEDQGLHFISFEFVEGENLRTILEKRGRLSIPEAVAYMKQVAQGLAHAAERGVVHRDIKPSNIIITPGGQAKLVDMGLARSLESLGDGELTQSGVTLGTFDYISPEQALEPREADVRSDIYSLGCTFYQMLTGQPPVPEGTAAKKLHHHQHIDPLDPRQLNPDVPDELAAVLARMMAKNPRHRYQHPEVLVQQLAQLEQHLGRGPAGLGALSPAYPPPSRPLLVGGLATFLLVGLVVVHSLSTDPAPRATDRAPVAVNPERRPAGPEEQPAPVAPPSPGRAQPPAAAPAAPAQESYAVRSARELADVLARKPAHAVISLTQDLNLTGERSAEAGGRLPRLVCAGEGAEVTLQSDGPQRRTIRLTYDANFRDGEADGVPFWTVLTVQGCKVTLRNLRFEVDARQAEVEMAAVRLREGGHLSLHDCEFIQRDPPLSDKARLSSVFVEGTAAQLQHLKSSLLVNDCYFGRAWTAASPPGSPAPAGQDALTLSGAATVRLTGCAFAPHAALVHLLRRAPRPEVRLQNCSALLAAGAAFQLDEGASGDLTVQNSLFSRPEAPPDGQAVLVQQAGDFAGEVQFRGDSNRYHNLTAFWVRQPSGDVVAGTWEQFRDAPQVQDDRSSPLSASPWAEKEPLKALEQGQPLRAFQPDVRFAELRTGPNRLAGVKDTAFGNVYGDLPPERAEARKVVDPTRETGGGYYKSLESAIREADPGDVILIRASGELPVESVRLEKAALDLTIQPYQGYRPVLRLGNNTDPDASLFRVHDSKLRLEQLEFRLKARQSDVKEFQSVVGLAGLGACVFKDCVFTLDADGGDDVTLAAVSLADPGKVMTMKTDAPPPRGQPEVRFENCFVRGRGDLLAVRASRPFDLRADNCVVALAGSFLSVDGNPRDPASAPAALVELKRVTTHLTGHLLHLRTGKNVKDLVPTLVRASDCLFASAGGEALVHFDGEVTDRQAIERVLTWEGEHNAYSNFKKILDQQARGEEMSLLPYDRMNWEDFTRERGSVYEKVKFPLAPDRPLAQSLPPDFKVKLEAETDFDFGADVHRLSRLLPERRPVAAPAVNP